MSSAQNIPQAIEAAIRARGGEVPAGVIVADLVAQGHGGASTVRRMASNVVVKVRRGNSFLWQLPSEPSAEGAKLSRTEAQEILTARGAEIDERWTDTELEALVEDLDEPEIREMYGPPSGAAPFAPRGPAHKPRPPRERNSW